jgi:hypothetical protein
LWRSNAPPFRQFATNQENKMDIEIHDNLHYIDPQYPKFKWQMRNDHILTLFGIPAHGHIPPDMFAYKVIGNVQVMIVPLGYFKIKRRVVAFCPKCKKIVCAGHLDQHMKVHNDRTRRCI